MTAAAVVVMVVAMVVLGVGRGDGGDRDGGMDGDVYDGGGGCCSHIPLRSPHAILRDINTQTQTKHVIVLSPPFVFQLAATLSSHHFWFHESVRRWRILICVCELC